MVDCYICPYCSKPVRRTILGMKFLCSNRRCKKCNEFIPDDKVIFVRATRNSYRRFYGIKPKTS